ncbi:MAG: hypothetical protein M9939_26260 [Mesorhizobium sp.]|nr:hypothetical protein [Mesorhizobium sp.]MCO5164596.1 hypothetical protein [Mesorhizobium sp.]
MNSPNPDDTRLSAVDLQAKLETIDWSDDGISELTKLQPKDEEGRYMLMLYISGYIIAHGHTLSAAELQALRTHAALVGDESSLQQ